MAIIYVKSGATGNGSAWNNAYGSLVSAIKLCKKISNVLVLTSGVTLATSGMLLVNSNPASASQLWNWTIGIGNRVSTGTFTTNDCNNFTSQCLVTGITGIDMWGDSIFQVPPPGSGLIPEMGTPSINKNYYLKYYDNLLPLTSNGIVFTSLNSEKYILFNWNLFFDFTTQKYYLWQQAKYLCKGTPISYNCSKGFAGDDRYTTPITYYNYYNGEVQFQFSPANPLPPSVSTPEPCNLIGFIILGGLMLGNAVKKAVIFRLSKQ